MPQFSARPTGGRKRRVDRPTEVVILPPPRHLPQAERDLWRRLGPAACRMGTLTAETVEGFVLLVQTVAARDEAARLIATQGLLVDGEAHGLLTHYRQLGQRAESLMAKFCLVAPGRPVQRPAATPVSKWDRILSNPRDEISPHDFYGEARKEQH